VSACGGGDAPQSGFNGGRPVLPRRAEMVVSQVSSAHQAAWLCSLDSALTGGYHLAFGISAGLVLSSIAVAATVLRGAPLFTPAARVEKSVARAASENPVGHF
jgi:hypothetical protein